MTVEPIRDNRKDRITATIALAMLLIISWMVYRPDEYRPFDLMDFPETLPVLTGNVSFSERVHAFTAHYLLAGRFNLVTYAAVSLQWQAFEWWTPGWQLVRFGIMSGLFLVSYQIIRRLGLAFLPSIVGAAVFIFSPAAARGYNRLTSAEPLGTLLLLLSCLIATTLRTSTSRRSLVLKGTSIAVLLAGAVLAKEILIAAVPFTYILALVTTPRTERGWRHDYFPVIVAALIGALFVGAALVPIGWAALHASPTSYGARFGSTGLSPLNMIGNLIVSTVPFIPAGGDVVWPPLLALGAYLMVLVVGITSYVANQTDDRYRRWRLVAAVSLPLAGMLAYSPWPSYLFFYAIPFLFGSAVLIALAIAGLQKLSPHAARLGWAAMAFVFIVGSSQALDDARYAGSMRLVIGRLVPLLAKDTDADTVLFAVHVDPGEPRGSFARRAKEFARATHYEWPPVRDVSCEDVPNVRQNAQNGSRFLIVRISAFCPPSPGLVRDSIRVLYRHLDWSKTRISLDSLRVDLVRPPSE